MSLKQRLRQNIFLIGDIEFQIIGNKLPSKLQALKVLFFHLRDGNQMSLRESATLVVNEVLIFWQKAHLPTRRPTHCMEQLETLHKTWRSIQKNAGKAFNREKEEAFATDLNMLFDIAHADIFDKIDESLKEFLLDQRKPERFGYISNMEPEYEEEQRIQSAREELRSLRQKRMEEEKAVLGKYWFDLVNITSSNHLQ